MRLPNGESADLGTKLEEYTLNPLHRDGRHKAHVFESVLAFFKEKVLTPLWEE